MAKDLLIPIAVRKTDGKLCCPDQQEKKGRFECPECKAEVFIRSRLGYRDHFVHKKETNCSASTESLVHLAAKEIISELGFIWLPELKVDFPLIGTSLNEEAKTHQFIECLKEVPIFTKEDRKIQPDLVVKDAKGYRLAVEITYRHPTDDDKKALFPGLNLPCVELDLSELPESIPLDSLRKIIEDSPKNYKWIHNRKSARLQGEEDALRRIEEAKRVAELRAKQIEEAKKARETQKAERELVQRVKREAQPLSVTWRDILSRSAKTPHVDKCPKGPRTNRGHSFANASLDCRKCDCYGGVIGPFPYFTAVRCGWRIRNPLPEWLKPAPPGRPPRPDPDGQFHIPAEDK